MFDPTTLVGFHTWLSLVAIAAGIPVAFGLLRNRIVPIWTEVFFGTAIATSATGFLFPFTGFLPSHAFGVVSLILLLPAAYGFWAARLAGGWRRFHAVAVAISLYLLVFVAVVQAFLKVPALHALAPTQAEPPFAIAQGLLLVLFVALLWLAAKRAVLPHAGIRA